MSDFIFPSAPSDTPTHRLISQGMIFEVIHFSENANGDGGSFTAIGMSHDVPKPPFWQLETLETEFRQNIEIVDYEDATGTPVPGMEGVRMTSCEFIFSGR